MYGPKNKRSALAALAAAGGLWAWQNRDKIAGWINSQRNQMQSHAKGGQSYTGATQRIDPSLDTSDYTGDRRAPKTYDANI